MLKPLRHVGKTLFKGTDHMSLKIKTRTFSAIDQSGIQIPMLLQQIKDSSLKLLSHS
jgi:hypothetical protein